MPDYIGVPLETDGTVLANQIFDELETEVPGWVPSDGNMDVRLINSFAGISAETRDLASSVPDIIFAQFGNAFMNVPQLQGAPSQISSTWTARDNAGYTIPQGTLVQGTDSLGNITFWSVYQDYVIAATTTSLAGVLLQALNLGSAPNGTTYLSGQVVLIDDLEFISAIVSNTSAAGGADAEDDSTYLNRLKNKLQLLTERPILPNDFSVLALDVAGVGRATTVDGYDLAGNTFNNAREVTVYVTDSNGLDPGSTIKTAVSTYLESLREANFIVNCSAPNYLSTTVVYTAKAGAGVDHTQLLADVNAAITNFLSPQFWGTPQVGESPSWVVKPYIYYLQLASVIQDVVGVDHVVSLTIDGSAADKSMTGSGPVSMPSLSTLTGTIT